MPDDPSDDSGDAPAEDLDDVPIEDVGEDGVLRPDELDVDDREEVRAIGDQRYVVSTEEGRPPTPRDDPPADAASSQPPTDVDPDAHPETSPSPDAFPPGAQAPSSGAHATSSGEPRSLAGALDGVEERYATALAVKTDRGVAAEEFASNNVVATFERTLRWYADRVDDSEPPEAVLRVLLAKSDLDL